MTEGTTERARASFLSPIFSDPQSGARRLTFAAGQTIHEPDAPADSVYFIHQGQVRLYQHAGRGVARLCDVLGADEWFGVAALARARTHGVRAMTVVPSVISQVGVERLFDVLVSRPHALVELTRHLAAKIQAARDDAAELTFHDTNQRLVRALLRLSDSAASTRRADGVVLNMTHRQLAQAVGAARETISLALTQLRHRNLVKTGRNQLIFDPEMLRRVEDNPLFERVA
ncbi:MAG: Crp/Fnr family transcriptional regulator [Tepidisphaeraceae bacterium]